MQVSAGLGIYPMPQGGFGILELLRVFFGYDSLKTSLWAGKDRAFYL